MEYKIIEIEENNIELLMQEISKLPSNEREELTLKRYGQLLSLEEVRETLRNTIKRWAVYKSSKFAGYGDIYKSKDSSDIELGYVILKKFQNKGLGLNLAKHILTYCLNNNYNKVKAEAEINNIASIRILDKLSQIIKPDSISINKSYTPSTKVCLWVLKS